MFKLHQIAALAWVLVSALDAAAQTSATTTSPIAAPARAESGGPAWSSLTPQQRKTLAPLERDWAGIDEQRKAKWLEVATRFPRMPAIDQQRLQERMTEWARMTPAERGRARLLFQESKQLSPQQKQERWEAYRALPDEQRQALADRNRPNAERPRASVPPTPLDAAQPKQNLVASAAASAPQARAVAPTLMQAKPGATTQLMNIRPEPPAHHQPGQPKIAGRPEQVDRSTLLPQKGPQAAASAARRP